MVSQLRPHVTGFLWGVGLRRAVFDTTPGKKSMTLALAALAPPGSWLVCCRVRTPGGAGRPAGHPGPPNGPARPPAPARGSQAGPPARRWGRACAVARGRA
jgi:hypothetical protein